MPMSWKLRFLPAAKQSFENQVRSQTEFGNEGAAEGLAERKAKCAWLLGAQGDNGIDGAGAARGQPAGNECDEHERRRKEEEGNRIAGADAVEQRRDQSGQAEGRGNAEDDAGGDERHSLAQD